MSNPYIIIGIVLAWLASNIGVGYWQNEAGHIAERSTWQAKNIAELALDNKAVRDTEEKYRSEERHHAEILSAVSISYEGQIENEKKKTAVLIASARAGTFRLRDPGAIACPPSGNITAETSASTGERDAAGDGGLSTDATEFLLALTGRCNAVRTKLTACQAVVVADRAVTPEK